MNPPVVVAYLKQIVSTPVECIARLLSFYNVARKDWDKIHFLELYCLKINP